MRITKKLATVAVKIGLVGCLVMTGIGAGAALVPAHASAAAPPTVSLGSNPGKYKCGSGKRAVTVSINFGCYGSTCRTSDPNGCSAVLDMTFAVIRFLSAGVGIIIIGSTIWAGIQYTSSRGDPNATAKAINRVRGNVIVMGGYIFLYAILNFVIPKGFFQ